MEGLYLIAAIAGRGVAVPSGQVDSVVDLGAVVPVPGAPAHVRGLAALRSKVVTVIDAAVALGEAAADAGAKRAVVVTVAGHVYAVLLDRVEDVAPFTPSRLPDGVRLQPGWADVADGMIESDGNSILVLDPAALILRNGGANQSIAA